MLPKLVERGETIEGEHLRRGDRREKVHNKEEWVRKLLVQDVMEIME